MPCARTQMIGQSHLADDVARGQDREGKAALGLIVRAVLAPQPEYKERDIRISTDTLDNDQMCA
jgi:hypothetical protein